jgi:hypothetical protein
VEVSNTNMIRDSLNFDFLRVASARNNPDGKINYRRSTRMTALVKEYETLKRMDRNNQDSLEISLVADLERQENQLKSEIAHLRNTTITKDLNRLVSIKTDTELI